MAIKRGYHDSHNTISVNREMSPYFLKDSGKHGVRTTDLYSHTYHAFFYRGKNNLHPNLEKDHDRY
ncbi:MAG TPA: hypothetical protein PK922_04315 [Syntrophorhabdus sp.]|nr:hypothetical protein [Syntrophorhabdus sp.]